MKRTSTPTPLSRRHLLRGAGGVAIGLPLLDAMVPRRQAAAAGPLHFFGMVHHNGYIDDAWRPTGGETDFRLSPTLAPLASLRKKILVVAGLDHGAAKINRNSNHQAGTVALFTGRGMGRGVACNPGSATANCSYGQGISIDQVIANKIRGNTRFRSLEIRVGQPGYGGLAQPWNFLSYSGKDQPLPAENDPTRLFSRLFKDPISASSNTSAEEKAAIERLLLERRSILDAVKADCARLVPDLCAEDRQKFYRHCTEIREMERRLAHSAGGDPGGATLSCARPSAPPAIDPSTVENIPQLTRLMMDLVAMAFACDLTRVATMLWKGGANQIRYNSWLPDPAHKEYGHHWLTHKGGATTNTGKHRNALMEIDNWYATQFSYFANKLESIKLGAGTMLDASLCLWTSDMHEGNNHTMNDLPFTIAGSAGGYFRTGRYKVYGPINRVNDSGNGINHNDLLISIQNAFGISETTFGDGRLCKGPLVGLT